MAGRKITQLPTLTTPAATDKLVIVDVSDTSESPQGTSKQIAVSNLGLSSIESTTLDVSIADGVATVDLPYLVYSALITQTETNAPVATVLQNTLGEDPAYTYNGVGSFLCQSSGIFDPDKTFVLLGSGSDTDMLLYAGVSDTSNIRLLSTGLDGTGLNDQFQNVAFEIRVYP